MNEQKKTTEKSNNKSGGFFQNLLDSIFGGQDAEKRRMLRNIAKRLSKTRFNKFYKYSDNEALPAMAQNFFEFYKIIYPAQTMFQSMQNQNALKSLCINFFITDDLRKIEESLSEENLRAMSKKMPIESVQKEALDRISRYKDFFSMEKINAINSLYKQLITFKDFCTFDYYFFLKKFNKTLREADFSVMPHFEKISADYICEDIKDFICIAWAIPLNQDFSNLIKLLRTLKGVEPVTLQNWKKVVMRLNALRQSAAFEMIIKLAGNNPTDTVTIPQVNSNIVEPYLEKLETDTENILNQLVSDERDSKTNDICSQLFGNIPLVHLKNYTNEFNETFSHKGLYTYTHIQPMNYLKTFLTEILKKDIHEYYDIVLVRGHWESQALSSPFSESYNSLLSISDSINEFDSLLAEDAVNGIKIKTLLPKTERDNGSKNIVNRLINDANTQAYDTIIASMKHLVTIGKILKSLVEDLAKPKPILVTNWKELEHFAERSLKEMSVEIYKKIYLLITLIKTCLVEPEDKSEE